jgi:hypothetical protein
MLPGMADDDLPFLVENLKMSPKLYSLYRVLLRGGRK